MVTSRCATPVCGVQRGDPDDDEDRHPHEGEETPKSDGARMRMKKTVTHIRAHPYCLLAAPVWER